MESVASCRCFHHVGPPEHDPGAMLKLLVYGYSYGIRSSRKLERATYHNLSFIWLVGGLKPDHKTISRFRRNNRSALQQVLRQCVRLSLQLGLIEGNTLFVDGSNKKSLNLFFYKKSIFNLGKTLAICHFTKNKKSSEYYLNIFKIHPQ